MFRYVALLFCVFFVVLTPYLTYAMTDEQKARIHAHFEELGVACMSDFPITGDDIGSFRAKKMGTSDNAPCFVACMMKKIGAMDDQGMLQKETALELAKKVFEDPEEIKNIEDFLHSCSHINSATVGDGTKGCERAAMAFKCMVENASQALYTESTEAAGNSFLNKL